MCEQFAGIPLTSTIPPPLVQLGKQWKHTKHPLSAAQRHAYTKHNWKHQPALCSACAASPAGSVPVASLQKGQPGEPTLFWSGSGIRSLLQKCLETSCCMNEVQICNKLFCSDSLQSAEKV